MEQILNVVGFTLIIAGTVPFMIEGTRKASRVAGVLVSIFGVILILAG
jgi:hypothetical protein